MKEITNLLETKKESCTDEILDKLTNTYVCVNVLKGFCETVEEDENIDAIPEKIMKYVAEIALAMALGDIEYYDEYVCRKAYLKFYNLEPLFREEDGKMIGEYFANAYLLSKDNNDEKNIIENMYEYFIKDKDTCAIANALVQDTVSQMNEQLKAGVVASDINHIVEDCYYKECEDPKDPKNIAKAKLLTEILQ